MQPALVNIGAAQGESLDDGYWAFAQDRQGATPLDLTGAHVHATFRSRADGSVLFDLSDANGGLVIDAARGRVTPAVTAAMTVAIAPGEYPYELLTTYPGGAPRTRTHYGVLWIFAAGTANP